MTSTRAGATVPAAVIIIGKNLPSRSGSHQHRFVPRRRSLRGQGVHRLSPRDARNQLQAECADAALGEGSHDVALGGGLQKADEHRSLFDQVDLTHRGSLDFEHGVGVLQQAGRVLDHHDAGLLVLVVRQECGGACPLLN